MGDNPKQYDQAFKALSDADPRWLLDVLGVLPESVPAVVEPLPRDIAARPLAVDAGYFVRPDGGAEFIAVFEALTSWKPEIGGRLAAYGSALGDRYRMPVRMYVLPLAEHTCPRARPEYGRVEWGDVEVATRLRWILPWTIDATLLLLKGSATLDAWVVVFQHTRAQLLEAVGRIVSRNEDAALFRILGALRYRKEEAEWISILGRIDQMLTRETMRESWAVQEWLDEGRVEGRVEGRLEGERRQAQTALLKLLASKFPQIQMDAEIHSIDAITVLDELFAAALDAHAAAPLVTAIENAARPASH